MSTDLAMFDEVKAALAEMKLKVENTIFPCETPEDVKAIRSFCAKFSKINGEIDRQHKAAKSQALEIGRAYDAEKKTLKEAVAEMKETVFAPVKAIEDKEAAEKQAALDKMEADRTAKEEADRKELDDLRKAKEESDRKEREAKIAEEAAAKVIEKAAQDKKDTAERAKKAKQKAVDKVKADAEAKAKVIEDARIAEVAEIARLQKIEDDRVTDVEHRAHVEGEIFSELLKYTKCETTAHAISMAIQENKIPHVTINY